MKFKPSKLILCLSTIAVSGWMTSALAAVIAHDAVKPFSENLTAVEIKFKPYLKITNGCVPFPAVDSAGNTSGGQQPSGQPNSGCSGSTGQVYARGGIYNNECGIMYAWYFPKDQPAAGVSNGHRHDWENIVVWLPASACSGNTNVGINAVGYSAHGGYSYKTGSSVDIHNGSHPKVNYEGFPLNHALSSTSNKGGMQPGVDWYRLTQQAGRALSTTSFGSANVPFIDKNFDANLRKAYYK